MEIGKVYYIKDKYWTLANTGVIELICPEDRTPMREIKNPFELSIVNTSNVMCPDCGFEYRLDLPFETAKEDVVRILDAKQYQKMDIIDIDGISTPVLKKKVTTKDGRYFVNVQVNESRRGPQLVVYAGERGKKNKSQIFVTPETRKMSFDHKDAKPTDIFTRITADFVDGSSNEIKQTEGEK